MNKEQQIEEIAMAMCEKHILWEGTQETCVEADKPCDNNCKWVILANTLYNAGYRKVSDSEAELQELNIKYYNEAKDLRRQLADIEAENLRLSKKLGQVLLSIDTVKEMNAMCNIDEYRKQAVKEFAEKLKEKTHNYYPSIDYYCCSEKAIKLADIDELLKEHMK